MTYVFYVVLVDLLVKILNIDCFSKIVKGKRLICIKLFVFWTNFFHQLVIKNKQKKESINQFLPAASY